MRHAIVVLAAAARVWSPPPAGLAGLVDRGASGLVHLTPPSYGPLAGGEILSLLGYGTEDPFVDFSLTDACLHDEPWPEEVPALPSFLRRTGLSGAVVAGDVRTCGIALAAGLAAYPLEDPAADVLRRLKAHPFVLAHLPVLGERTLLELTDREVLQPLARALEQDPDLRLLVTATAPDRDPVPYVMAGPGLWGEGSPPQLPDAAITVFGRFVQSFHV